ncbi:hypothetical protein NE865_00727 [Phthorimaea operculella]|nr:hypothetical protein NE865_00727 [Phthorimaea operculella]
MESLKVCRMCLVMDVKMQNLQSFPWATYLEPMFEVDPIAAMSLPPYACYECAVLLKKNHNFREKCLLGQSVLQSILQINGTITPDHIRALNRQDMNLVSNLKPQFITEDSFIEVTDGSNKDCIKYEPVDLDEDQVDEKLDILKAEDGFEDFAFGALSSEDDEPLSLQKIKNEKKSKEKKKSKKAKRKVEEVNDLKVEFDPEPYLDETSGSLMELGPVKKKRGRPRKTETADTVPTSASGRTRRTKNTGGVSDDELDLEEYVNIIKLTEEEQIEEITQRQFSSNYQNAAFQCNLCFKGFIDTHAWRHHVGKHDPSAGDVECHICKFRFKNKRALQKHAANHEKKYACKSCPYVSKTTTQAKQHQRWHKGVTYKCQHCDEVST